MLSSKLFANSGGGLSKFFVEFPKDKTQAVGTIMPDRTVVPGWERTIRILDQNDPYYFNQHRFQVAGRWQHVYCLGSPADGWRGHDDDLVLEAAGVERCQSIMVPGLNRPLHEVDDGGSVRCHFLVWEWDSHMVKVLAVPAGGSLYKALEDVLSSQGSLTSFDLFLSCSEGNGTFWNYAAMPKVQSQDLGAVQAEIAAQLQPPTDDSPSVHAAYNPVMTYEAIMERLKRAMGDKPAAAAPQTTIVAPNVNFEGAMTPPNLPSRLVVPSEQPAPVAPPEPVAAPATQSLLDMLRQQPG